MSKERTLPNPDVKPNLVSTWILVEKENGRRMAEALRDLNSACDTKYRQSMIRSWERSESLPGRTVYGYMLKQVLPFVLMKYGVKKKDLSKAIDMVLMPDAE